MPLTSANSVYKNFPNVFAENVTQHFKRRAQTYRNARNNDMVLQNLDDDEISEACSHGNNKQEQTDSNATTVTSKPPTSHTHSRLTPEMRRLRMRRLSLNLHGGAHAQNGDSESDTSSATTTPSTTPGTTPRSRATPSPRSSGLPVNFIESPRPHSGATGSVRPLFTGSSNTRKLPRSSPRTTCSLDNVDLWEESDTDAELNGAHDDADDADNTLVNLAETVDMSDLRRSQSPVACKRNKVSDDDVTRNADNATMTVVGRQLERKEHKCVSKKSSSRARVNRRFKHMFNSPRTAMTLREARETDDVSTEVSPYYELSKQPQVTGQKPRLLSNRNTRLASTTFTKVRSKSELFSTTTNLSTLSESLSIEPTARVQKPNWKTNPSTNDCNLATVEKNMASRDVKSAKTSTRAAAGNDVLNAVSAKALKEATAKALKEDTVSQRSPSARKVKFNSFVTVREDENNTLDFLKNSTDTAKVFKNRYLKSDLSSSEGIPPFLQTIH